MGTSRSFHRFFRARSLAAAGLLVVSCLSFEARGDGPEPTEETDLSPGIRLRINSCGYTEPTRSIDPVDDDDSAGDDDTSDDDDDPGDDDDDPDDDDDDPDDDDDSASGDDDSASGDDDSASGDDDSGS